MSIERAIERQTEAMQELTEAIRLMASNNQQLIELIVEVLATDKDLDDPMAPPKFDMDGSPI